MGLETRDREIGRYRYFVTQLGAKKGREAFSRLVKVLGPVVAHVVDGATADGIRSALVELASRMEQRDLDYFCETFGEFSTVELEDGKRPKLSLAYQEMHFAGQFGEMFKWLAFAAEVNFGDFFGALVSGASADQRTGAASP
jgi:hypothetical protein